MHDFGGSASSMRSVPLKRARKGPMAVATTTLNSVSLVFSTDSQPGKHCRKMAGSLRASQTVWRSALMTCVPLISIRSSGVLLHRGGGIHHRVKTASVVDRALFVHARRHAQIFLQAEDGGTRTAQDQLAETFEFAIELRGGDDRADDAIGRRA